MLDFFPKRESIRRDSLRQRDFLRRSGFDLNNTFDNPKLEELFKKFQESAKKAPIDDQKRLIRKLIRD